MAGIEHPRTQSQHVLIKIHKLKQFKHFINKKIIPPVDKGKAPKDVEMHKTQMNQTSIYQTKKMELMRPKSQYTK